MLPQTHKSLQSAAATSTSLSFHFYNYFFFFFWYFTIIKFLEFVSAYIVLDRTMCLFVR